MTSERQINRARSPTVELLRSTANGKLYKVIQAINDGAELAINKNGHNALHIASHKGFLDIVRILLSAGCELDVQDDNGDTALHRACIAGHDLIVRRLIDEGCSVDRQNQIGDTALHEASSRGYSRCVKALIEGRVNIGLRNKNQDTAIHLACANSHSGSLRLLLSAYPHSSPKNAQGDTPLHIAVRFGHVTCSRVLISSHCNVNLQNKVGNTALHIATFAKHRKLVRILLDAGASASTILNNDNKSPLDVARDNDDGETAIMLMSGPHKKFGADSRGRKIKKYGSSRRSRSEPRKQEIKDKVDMHEATVPCDAKKQPLLKRPKSATLPRKQYVQARAKWHRHERRKMEERDKTQNILEDQQHTITVNPFVVPQLYSLYRDCHGNVRQRPVIDQLPNPTPEIVSSITNAVSNTKGELLQEMKKTNCLLEKRLDELETNTDFKVAKLDQITKQRIHAERMRCLHRIDRRAMMERAVATGRATNHKCGCQDKDSAVNSKNEFGLRGRNMGGEGDVVCDGDSPNPLHSPSAADFQGLQPYKTVKVSSDAESPCCSSPKSVQKHWKKRPENYSDSAYGSLSQRPTLESFSLSKNSSRVRSPLSGPNHILKSGHFSNTPDALSKGNHKFSFNRSFDSDVSFTNNLTQQFFENVTYAMEDWYERRLHEITDRQQKEMDRKVTELENKIRVLQSSFTPGNSNTNSSAETKEDLV